MIYFILTLGIMGLYWLRILFTAKEIVQVSLLSALGVLSFFVSGWGLVLIAVYLRSLK